VGRFVPRQPCWFRGLVCEPLASRSQIAPDRFHVAFCTPPALANFQSELLNSSVATFKQPADFHAAAAGVADVAVRPHQGADSTNVNTLKHREKKK